MKWKSFKKEQPPIDAALDNPAVKNTRTVLVTNNLKARDRMGRMSHVWWAMPVKSRNGTWSAYTDDGRLICALTHWFDPFAAPEKAEGKEDGK